MKKETFILKVFSFRNIETPFSKKGHKNYYSVIDVKDLPNLEEWREINVRDPKLTGSVPKKISASFRDNEEMFLFMNRGITLSVESANFDNKTSELHLTLSDKEDHGLLDGGHTYTIIKEEAKRLSEEETRYVKLEILEGFVHEEITDVVGARNTSNQVKDQSLMELENRFEKLKLHLPKGYDKLVAFSEYETDDEGNAKPIDIRDIIALLTVFNKDLYNDVSQPVVAYSSKQECLKKFKVNGNTYEKMYPLVKDIFKLYNTIYLNFPEIYGQVSKMQKGKLKNGFGHLTGVTRYEKGKGPELYFGGGRAEYAIPSGFIFPMLGAFRAFLEEKNGVYTWGKNAKIFNLAIDELGAKLVGIITDEALKNQNPNKTGKSSLLWQNCYQTAELFYLKMK
jgi:hypothetical protein